MCACVRMCMYVCVCACISVSMYVYVCAYINVCVRNYYNRIHAIIYGLDDNGNSDLAMTMMIMLMMTTKMIMSRINNGICRTLNNEHSATGNKYVCMYATCIVIGGGTY